MNYLKVIFLTSFICNVLTSFLMTNDKINYLIETGLLFYYSGTVVFKTNQIYDETINVTFLEAFIHVPNVVFGIADIQVTGGAGFGFEVIGKSKSSFVVKGIQTKNCLYGDPIKVTTKLRLYYFVYDEIQTENIYDTLHLSLCHVFSFTCQTTSSNPAPKISSKKDLRDNSVHMLCTITHVCLIYNFVTTFQIFNSCTKQQATIDIYSYVNENINISPPTIIPSANFLGMQILLILQNTEMTIRSGVLNLDNTLIGLFNYVPGDANNIFFIGLSGVSLQTRAFNLELDLSDRKVKFNPIISLIHYRYIFIQFISNQRADLANLQRIQSEIFKNNPTFQFYYENINMQKALVKEMFDTSSATLTATNVVIGSNPKQAIFHVNVNPATVLQNSQISIHFFDQKKIAIYRRTAKSIIFYTKQIRLYFFKNKFILVITGNHAQFHNKFKFIPNLFTNKIDNIDDSTQFDLNFQHVDIGQSYLLSYQDPINGAKIQSKFTSPSISMFQTNVNDNKIFITIDNLPSSISPLTSSKISLSSNLSNFTINSPSKIQLNYIYNSNQQLYHQISLSNSNLFKMKFCFQIFTISTISTYSNSKQAQIQFANSPSFKNTLNIIIAEPSISITNISTHNQNIILGIQFSSQSIPFNIQLSPTIRSFPKTIVSDVKIKRRFVSINVQKFTNRLNIVLENQDLLSQSDLANVLSVKSEQFKIKDLKLDNHGNIVMSLLYERTAEERFIRVIYNYDNSNIYKESIMIDINQHFPIVYCQGLFNDHSNIYQHYSRVLSVVYLILFIVAFVSYNKIMGIQTIFLAQLTFYSFLPIGMFCKPFADFLNLQYVRGYNPLFQGYQSKTSNYYSSMQIHSNFTANINIMLIPIIISFFLYVPFRIISHYSNCYKRKPRFLKYANSCIFQVPMAILLFNSFNIYNSLVVQIQYFHNLTELMISLFVALLLPGYFFIHCFLKRYFSEFNEEFEDRLKIRDFSLKTSKVIRTIYPLIMIVEMIIIPIIISTQRLFKFGLYCVLFVEFLILMFTSLISLYFWGYQNIRTIIHRSIIVTICLIQSIQLFFITQHHQEDSFYWWIPLIVLIMLTFGALINGTCIFWMAYKWFKTRGVVDNKMRSQIQVELVKPVDHYAFLNDLYENNTYHGKSQHSSRQYMKLKIPNINKRTNKQVKQCMILMQQKSQSWFKQIEYLSYFQHLYLNKQDYNLVKNCLKSSSKANCCKILKYFTKFLSDSIVSQWQSRPQETFQQYLAHIGREGVTKIQQFNKDIQRIFKNAKP